MNEHVLPSRLHNAPPDPIDEAMAPYDAERQEAEHWLDGTPVETEAQMNVVDALRSSMRKARLAVETAEKSECAPLHDAWKAAKARYKPTLDDLGRIEKGLVTLVDGFKRALAEKKAEAERIARAEAAAAAAVARGAARAAEASNIDASRAAAEAQKAAEIAARKAAEASRDQVKGLRTVTETVVVNDLELARHLWLNDHEAVLAFNAERARTLKLNIPGVVEQRTERRAY